MKRIILFTLLLLSTFVFAQDENEIIISERIIIEDELVDDEDQITKRDRNRNEIKTLAGHGHNGGFFGITFKTTQFNHEPIVTAGVRAGWIMGRAIAIGFEAHGIVPTAKFDQIVPPDKVILLGGYGGMFLEPILFSNQVVHLTFPFAAGAGWLGYHQDWEQDFSQYNLVEDDIFWYIEPGVSVEVNISRNFRIALGASQRFTQELELSNTPAGAFDNKNYHLTLKFGRF